MSDERWEICGGCGADLLTLRYVSKSNTVVVNDDDESGAVDTEDQEFTISLQAIGAPGLVNRTKRHPSGLPWYGKPRQGRSTASMTIRLPAVITCGCGEETTVQGLDESGRFYAEAWEGDRHARLADEIQTARRDDASMASYDDRERDALTRRA